MKQIEGVSSGVAPIFVEPNGQNRIFVVKGANDLLKPADVDAAADLLKTVDCMVLQFEIPLETVYYSVAFAHKNGIRCIVNPAPAQPLDLNALAGLDYFVPNESEAEAITGIAVRNVDDAKKCAEKLLSGGVKRVILTLGANGSLLAGREGHGAHSRVQREKRRQHRGRGRIHWQLCGLPRRRPAGARSRPPGQPVCRALDHERGDTEIIL